MEGVGSSALQLCPFSPAIFIVDVILNFPYIHHAFPSGTSSPLSRNIPSLMNSIKYIE